MSAIRGLGCLLLLAPLACGDDIVPPGSLAGAGGGGQGNGAEAGSSAAGSGIAGSFGGSVGVAGGAQASGGAGSSVGGAAGMGASGGPSVSAGTGGSEPSAGGGGSATTGGSAGMGGDPGPVRDDIAQVGRNVAIEVDVLANDTLPVGVSDVTIVAPPSRGTVVVLPGGRLRYSPAFRAPGPIEIGYRVLGEVSEIGQAKLRVDVRDEDWLATGTETFSVAQEADPPVAIRQPAERARVLREGVAAVRWAVERSLTGARALRLENGTETALHGDAPFAVVGHANGAGQIAGFTQSGGVGTGFLVPAAAVSALPGEQWWGVEPNGAIVGAQQAADGALSALRIDPAGVRSPLPAGTSTQSRALGVADAPLGEALLGGTWRAVRWTDAGPSTLLVDDGAGSRAFDGRADGTVVGTRAIDAARAEGFLLTAAGTTRFLLPHEALGASLEGVDEALDGALLGAATTAQGFAVGLALSPLVLPAGQRAVDRPDPPDEHTTHACGHTKVPGDKIALVASATVDKAPLPVHIAHKQYVVTMPPPVDGLRTGYIRYRAAMNIDVTYYVFPHAPLRVFGTDGTRQQAETFRSRSCDSISWIHQHSLTGPAEYVLAIGPTTEPTVSIVLERGHFVE